MNVSVIIPTYNRSEQTLRAIMSVAHQSYKKLELIVVDDGSTDNTFSRVFNYLKTFKNIDYKLIQSKNQGVSHARNLGVQLSKFNDISFLDSDDEWLPNKLELQVNYLKANPKKLWVYTNENWIKNNKYLNKPKTCEKFAGDVFTKATERCFIGTSTVLINKKLFLNFGGFNTSMPVCEDYDLWLKLLADNPVGYINEPLINKYAGHDDQLSFKFASMNYWRILSLNNILSDYRLKPEQILSAQNFINEKAPSLIEGFYKYQKPEKAQEIEAILKLRKKANSSIQNSSY